MKVLHHKGVPSLLLAACTAWVCVESAQAQTTVPLVTFYSPGRGDFFTTSQPEWTCKIHGCTSGSSDDYKVFGMQGHVFNPALAQPVGSIALWHWYSEVRGDNFITSNALWNPASGTFRSEGGANYRYVRLVGYINPAGVNRHLSLVSYWNAAAGDNAAVTELVGATGATLRARVPAGYVRYRVEGALLPPPSDALRRCTSGAAPSRSEPSPWTARGAYIDRWPSSAGLRNGDAIKFTAPTTQTYTIDYWGNTKPIRGVFGDRAPVGSSYPAAGVLRYALLGRVSTGRVYVDDQGWFEANQWFHALGEYTGSQGACVLYDGQGVGSVDLQTGFNDDNLSDNGGGASVKVNQWYE